MFFRAQTDLQLDGRFTDVDRQALIDMSLEFLPLLAGNVYVDLANSASNKFLTKERNLCVIKSPFMAFIKPVEKVDLMENILQNCSHSMLPLSPQSNRFLATPKERKLHINALKFAAFGFVRSMDILTYGQKTFVTDYEIFDAVTEPTVFEYDLGKYVTCGRNGMISLVGCDADVIGARNRPMMMDLLCHRGCPPAGSVEIIIDKEEAGVTYQRMKIYPVFVHYLKAEFPANLVDLGKTMTTLRQKVNILSNLACSASSSSAIDSFSQVRVEVSVSFRAGNNLTFREVVSRVPAFVADYMRQCYVINVPVIDFSSNLRAWLDRAAGLHLNVGRNNEMLSKVKTMHLKHLMNEAGIATDSVLKNLRPRRQDGRFWWEVYTMPHASPYVLTEQPVGQLGSHGASQGISEAGSRRGGSVEIEVRETAQPASTEGRYLELLLGKDRLELMSNIRRRVNISRGTKAGTIAIRNKRGNIVKSMIAGEEIKLFGWVYRRYGADFAQYLSCR